MTLQEEVELLERKVKALKELEHFQPMRLNVNPLIKNWPSRLNDVDPVIRDLMTSQSCIAIS